MAEPMNVDSPAASPPASSPPSAQLEEEAIKAAKATLANASSSVQDGQADAVIKQGAEPEAAQADKGKAGAHPSTLERQASSKSTCDGDEASGKTSDDDAKSDAKSSNSKASLKRLNSDMSAASTTGEAASTAPKKKKARKSKSGRRSPASTSARSGKTGYQGGFRSAAAAHRNRQIHVPPLGSPGLLMQPTPAAMAVFPSVETEGGDIKKDVENYLVTGEDGGEYFLPASVFKQSMIAGGYTYDKRRARPHRGSSTERHVGDMFDSDAGGLCLHFPELIPTSIWDHRLGDGRVVVDVRPPSPKKESGGLTSADFKDINKATASRPGPKGARSSYIFFTNEQRPKMVLEFPGVRFAEQGVIMGERWRALTPEERKPYEDMATKDKERYAREMREYVGLVKRDMEEEKASREGATSAVKEEPKGGEEGKDQSESKEGEEDKEEGPRKAEVFKGPRLVDSVILSLSKMLGEKVNRNEVLDPLSKADSSAEKTDAVSSGAKPEEENGAPRRVTPDLTVAELPLFTPSSPGTLPHASPHKPISFLSMLPITLTSTYPPAHVAAKKAYARDVRKREEAIVQAQETKDDAEDAKEKYAVHVEAWERMLEYQKGQAAKRDVENKKKREAERQLAKLAVPEKQGATKETKSNSSELPGVRQRKSGKWEVATNYYGKPRQIGTFELREQAAAASVVARRMLKTMDGPRPSDDEIAYDVSLAKEAALDAVAKVASGTSEEARKPELRSDGVGTSSADAEKKEAASAESKTPASAEENSSSDAPGGKKETPTADKETPADESANSEAAVEKRPPPRAPSPPPEDPMEYMPPRPEKPGPAPVITIPDIPIPPSPPGVVARESGVGKDAPRAPEVGKDTNADVPMQVPKLDRALLNHLDPTFFQPTMTGRYFGLLSNHIADPQFHGVLAPGIAGTTYGGGTGLATSYVGGKGTSGLVSGPVRGAIWDRSTSVGSKSEKKRDGKKSKPKASPDSAKSSKDATKNGDGSPSSAAPSSSEKKRRASDGEGSAEKKKKPKRTLGLLGLATGDRKTNATEVGAGPAGSDFPEGWIVKTYRRSGGETVGKTDRFWFSPGRNIRFRARKHAMSFVEILGEPDVNGDEDRAAEIYRARGLHF